MILTARTSQESSDDDYIALKLDPDGSVLWRLEVMSRKQHAKGRGFIWSEMSIGFVISCTAYAS